MVHSSVEWYMEQSGLVGMYIDLDVFDGIDHRAHEMEKSYCGICLGIVCRQQIGFLGLDHNFIYGAGPI